ncbi:MAG: right-handed parallel beta-helix repeat-containing protein, partial [Candidatus Kariarchaeaceae archaeon]
MTTILIISYLSYSTIIRLQLYQNSLTEKYDDLAFQYSNIQANYSKLQNNWTEIHSQLTNLTSKHNTLQTQQSNLLSEQINFQSQYDELQSQQNNLLSQFSKLQSQYSNLQTSYTQFMEDYPRLRPIADFSYLIFGDRKGNYYAENGITRVVDYSGTNGSQVAQNCLNALATSGGKIVFTGKINLDTPLTIQKGYTKGNLEISGFGPSTQLLVSQGSDGIQIIGDQAFGYGGPYHVVIRDLALTTKASPNGTFMSTGIYIKNWFGVDIENVMIFYANKSGILIEDSANVHLDNVYVEGGTGTEYGGIKPLNGVGFWLRGSKDTYFDQCYSDTNEIGFLIDSNTNNIPRNVFLSQCEATLNNQKGILITNADGISVSNSLVEGSNSDGIFIVDSFRVNLFDILIIGNVGNGIMVTSQDLNMTQSEIRIIACTINSNNRNGIEILAKNGETISHVSIESSTII